jgi:hypothetical protein
MAMPNSPKVMWYQFHLYGLQSLQADDSCSARKRANLIIARSRSFLRSEWSWEFY